jgi:hypothetical protein
MTDEKLIAELLRRRDAGELRAEESAANKLPKPLARDKVRATEKVLGQKLPPLMFRIYTEVANGGFGPSYGLLGLSGGPKNEAGRDVVRLWKELCKPDRDDKYWKWREELLPVVHLGCGMYHCVDCSSKNSKVVLFEPNIHEEGRSWRSSFMPFSPSLNRYLSAWLEGADIWEVFAR